MCWDSYYGMSDSAFQCCASPSPSAYSFYRWEHRPLEKGERRCQMSVTAHLSLALYGSTSLAYSFSHFILSKPWQAVTASVLAPFCRRRNWGKQTTGIVFSGKLTKDEWLWGDTRDHPEPPEAVLVRASWGCGPAPCEGTCLSRHGQWETNSSRGAAKFNLEFPPLFEALSHPIFYLSLPALHWNPEKSDLRDRVVIRGF